MEPDDTDTSNKADGLFRSRIADRNTITQEITATNAHSELLRLPQEIKQLIYESILGGQLIHIFTYREGSDYSLTHCLCQAKLSEKEAERIFAASHQPWFSTGIQSRHEACYPSSFREAYFRRRKQDFTTQFHAQLSLAFLRCCRQMYQEARSTIFSNSTFSFIGPWDFPLFYYSLWCQIQSNVRSLHLDIIIDSDLDEKWWNKALDFIARDVKSLQHIYINIDQRPKEDHHLKEWNFKNPAECSFLKGLRSLIHLKLKSATVIISDYHISHPDLPSQQDKTERWTMLQRQEWAEYTKRLLLHQEEEQTPGIEEVV